MTSPANCKQFGMITDQITLRRAHSNFQARLLFNLDSPHYRKNELTFRISWMVLDSASQDDCKYSIHILHGSLSWLRFTTNSTKHVVCPGGYSPKNWVGVSGSFPKTLTLFMTKICDIPYPVYDVTFKSKPCF